MGRKGTKPKLLMCLMAASAIVTGIIGSVSMPVKAAEEENYTVTFEAYEGTCEAESITVPKGESLTLPEAYYGEMRKILHRSSIRCLKTISSLHRRNGSP